MVTPKHNVYLFIGDDTYLKEKALKDLSSSVLGKSSDRSELKIFRGRELEPQSIFDQLTTVSLLSDKRLIVIKDVEEVPGDFTASLIEYIRKPSKSAYLVLDAQDDSVLRDYGQVADKICVQKFGIPRGGSLGSWIRDFVASNGKTIDSEALLVLRELEGNELAYLARELEKVITFVGARKEITSDDIEEVVGKSLVMSAFDITDAIGRKNIAGAIKISSNLLSGGKKEYEIIGLICWHLKRMLRAKTLKARGQSDYNIAGILRIGQKFQDDFFKQAAGFKLERLRSHIDTLLQADLDIKRTKFSPSAVLEFAIIRLCLF